MHGHQEGRFFHGYYDCYCYLPLYVFCGRHLLAAKLRRSNIDASAGAFDEVARIIGQIRARWPRVHILLRADSGFARDELMAWCEAHAVDYTFGLARNDRLIGAIADDLVAAAAESLTQGDGPWSGRRPDRGRCHRSPGNATAPGGRMVGTPARAPRSGCPGHAC